MKYNFTKLLAFIAVILFAPFAAAQDFGLIINQKMSLADRDYVYYSATALPWFAAPLGEKAGLYLSGGASAEYENGTWAFVPEVYRFEVTCRPSDSAAFGFGRQNFRDGTGWVMNGLFDGVSAAFAVNGGWLDFGVFYTGLLYKKTAAITISQKDQFDYYMNDTYFASRRVAGGVNWEKTSIFDSESSFWFSALFQFDLNDVENENKVHSQYLTAKFAVPLNNTLNLECGAAAEILEKPNFSAAFAAFADMAWLFYGKYFSMFTLGGRFSSGEWNDVIAAFSPVTGQPQGRVLLPDFFGIALAQADYMLRLHRTLSAELYAAYLFRTDIGSSGTAGTGSASPLLGGEVYIGFSWAPFSDLVFTLGGGVFLPQLGKAFANDSGVKYRVEITAGISL